MCDRNPFGLIDASIGRGVEFEVSVAFADNQVRCYDQIRGNQCGSAFDESIFGIPHSHGSDETVGVLPHFPLEDSDELLWPAAYLLNRWLVTSHTLLDY